MQLLQEIISLLFLQKINYISFHKTWWVKIISSLSNDKTITKIYYGAEEASERVSVFWRPSTVSFQRPRMNFDPDGETNTDWQADNILIETFN